MSPIDSLRILLIEDDDDHAALIEAHARRSPGFVRQLTRARTLQEGTALMQKAEHDLALLDLSLPDSSLEQTLGSLAALQASSDVPVVVLTSLSSTDLGRRATHSGAQDYLSKDATSLQRLEQSARYAIERNRLRVELRRAEQRLAQANSDLAAANSELERSNQELSHFAYLAAHDLQEPLRTTMGLSKVIGQRLQGKLDERTGKAMGLMQDAVLRMSRLVRDLLDYSQVGRTSIVDEVDCDAMVDAVLADLSAAIQKSGAQVQKDELPGIRGRKTELRMLFQNLIGNALKFSSPDRPPRVRVSSKLVEPGVHAFEVEDNGIGIEETYHQRIFEIFQRLHSRDEYDGSGIGLANCQRVVQSHGGQISVRSTPGRGSTFCFTLRDQKPRSSASVSPPEQPD